MNMQKKARCWRIVKASDPTITHQSEGAEKQAEEWWSFLADEVSFRHGKEVQVTIFHLFLSYWMSPAVGSSDHCDSTPPPSRAPLQEEEVEEGVDDDSATPIIVTQRTRRNRSASIGSSGISSSPTTTTMPVALALAFLTRMYGAPAGEVIEYLQQPRFDTNNEKLLHRLWLELRREHIPGSGVKWMPRGFWNLLLNTIPAANTRDSLNLPLRAQLEFLLWKCLADGEFEKFYQTRMICQELSSLSGATLPVDDDKPLFMRCRWDPALLHCSALAAICESSTDQQEIRLVGERFLETVGTLPEDRALEIFTESKRAAVGSRSELIGVTYLLRKGAFDSPAGNLNSGEQGTPAAEPQQSDERNSNSEEELGNRQLSSTSQAFSANNTALWTLIEVLAKAGSGRTLCELLDGLLFTFKDQKQRMIEMGTWQRSVLFYKKLTRSKMIEGLESQHCKDLLLEFFEKLN